MWFPAVTDGPELGSVTVTKPDEGMDVLIPFGPEGIAEITDTLGGDLLIGGAVTTVTHPLIDDIAEGLFHHTHPYGIMAPVDGETPEPKLILEIIPEPSVTALFLPALTLLLRRRR